MSQQFQRQWNNPRMLLFVQGSRIRSLFFHVLVPVWDTDMSLIELYLRVCPNAVLSQTQAEYHPQIFLEFAYITFPENWVGVSRIPWLETGWDISCWRVAKIKSLGPVPAWDTYSLWNKINASVDRHWNDARHQLLMRRNLRVQRTLQHTEWLAPADLAARWWRRTSILGTFRCAWGLLWSRC